ncbi:MAG: NAD(P)H-dependent oxidoreductase [Fibrobacterales bacterium]
MSKELIILGHPDSESFCNAISDTYYRHAKESGKDIDIIKLSELEYDPNLSSGFRARTELELDLLTVQEKIKQADHLVWVFPVWWATIPAQMKGFIDRVFLPG